MHHGSNSHPGRICTDSTTQFQPLLISGGKKLAERSTMYKLLKMVSNKAAGEKKPEA
jgi:hypothetical protein